MNRRKIIFAVVSGVGLLVAALATFHFARQRFRNEQFEHAISCFEVCADPPSMQFWPSLMLAAAGIVALAVASKITERSAAAHPENDE